jgi:transcriptional regulator with XRE-family HTH domain
MRGKAPFDPAALESARRAVRRPDRDRLGLSVDELAKRAGTSRRQVISYLKDGVVPEPARLRALAEAVEVDVRVLMGVTDDMNLANLRRCAGLTLKTASAKARSRLTGTAVRCSPWLLSELEAGRIPAAWRAPEAHGQLATALATVYAVPIDQVVAAWPARDNQTATEVAVQPDVAPVDADDVVPTYRLFGPSWDTWYVRCPGCELVSTPTSASVPLKPGHRDVDWTSPMADVDWSSPFELRCGQCGTLHQATVDQLEPHDAVVTCHRSTCRREFAAPRTAVRACCDFCHLTNYGPAVLADDQVRVLAANVLGRHTLELQATLAAAKDRARARGSDHFLLTPNAAVEAGTGTTTDRAPAE